MKKVTKLSVWVSFISGVGITVGNMFLKFFANSIVAGAVAMIAGLILVPLVSLITPKLKKDYVEKCFICYDKDIKEKANSDIVSE